MTRAARWLLSFCPGGRICRAPPGGACCGLTPRQGLLELWQSETVAIIQKRALADPFCTRGFRPIGRYPRHRTRRSAGRQPPAGAAGSVAERTHAIRTHTTNPQPRRRRRPFKEIGSTLGRRGDAIINQAREDGPALERSARAELADLEPLLLFAEENGLVGLLGDLNDELLPLLPLLVDSHLGPSGRVAALGLGPLASSSRSSFGGAFVDGAARRAP